MINNKASFLIRDGVGQNDRFQAPLKAGYVHVDEMGFEALLSMGADLARILTFYNAENERDGTWEPFFTADEAVLMATILSMDLKYIYSAYRKLFTHSHENHDTYYLTLAVQSYKLAQSIDFWCKGLVAIDVPVAQSVGQKISSVIQKKLIDDLHALGSFLGRYESTVIQKYGINFRSFHRIWKIEMDKEKRFVFPQSYPLSLENRAAIKDFLKSNFYTFFDAIVYLQGIAAAHLPDALESGTHKPVVGLYIAFLKLYQKVQEKTNRFTRDHRYFYYDEVLQIKSQRYVPDSTYLLFEPDGDKEEVLIQKGTEFTAGKDENGEELIYAADGDLLVNRAKVADLHTLYLERNPLISPERELGYVTGIRTIRVPVSDTAGTAEDGAPNVWPLFGMPKTEAQKPLFKEAPIGFAVASSVLLLKEGERNLRIYLRIGHDSNKDSGDLSTVIEKIAQIIGTTGADAFQKLFGKIFRIELTTESGWIEVPEYVINHRIIDHTCPKDCLHIQFRLRPEAASITPYEPEVHGGRFDTDLPILRMVINPDAYIYPYSLLKDLLIREIKIHADVREVKDVLLYNTMGQLDPNTPFQPFGPAPAVGSYVVIGNFEAARKTITRFEVNFEWDGLPSERGGFGVYYQAYGIPFDEALFEARVSVLRDGAWYPQNTKKQPRVKLFVSGSTGKKGPSSGTPLGMVSQVTLETDGMVVCKPVSPSIREEAFSYDVRAKDGFYKFTLSAPEYAFGHREYPLVLSTILTENARLKKLQQSKPVPNPPYTPVARTVSINYRAVTVIDMEKDRSRMSAVGQDRVFHLHPRGIERIFPARRDLRRHLLPQYHWDGNLFIGLAAPEAFDVITLFFHLRDDSTQGTDTEPPEIQWFYLAADQWKPLERFRVISDTTNGFLSSGIVTLHIPGDIATDNTLMPARRYWLRVSADRHLHTVCSLYSVKTQALKVSWQNRGNALSHLKTGLPAGTIKEPKVSIPGIKTITQTVDSFGGKPEESRERLETRISERLTHKNRAVTPWDYERLILQQFPEIFKVKCFSGMSTHRQPIPGHLLIAVIPRHRYATAIHRPPLANSFLLKAIEAYIEKLSSPFAKIEVRNPAYEHIQIRCTVKFTQGLREGYYINKLNQAISDYLSPWTSTGYQTGFGWCVRRSDLVPYIQGLDYIDFVTNFSMLRIAGESVSGFTLFDTAGQPFVVRDTAKDDTEPEQIETIEVRPQVPWSIAVPFRRHFIEMMEKFKPVQPEVTGIDELEVGNTFIVTT
jgi:hypothetical protein